MRSENKFMNGLINKNRLAIRVSQNIRTFIFFSIYMQNGHLLKSSEGAPTIRI